MISHYSRSEVGVCVVTNWLFNVFMDGIMRRTYKVGYS